jgi:hypothetical protein
MYGSFPRALVGVFAPLGLLCYLVVATVSYYDNLAQVPIGEVTWKEFHPAHTSFMMVPMKVGDVTIMQQQPVYHPKWWGVTVEGTRRDGDWGSYEWHVTPQEFNSYAVGDDFPTEEED